MVKSADIKLDLWSLALDSVTIDPVDLLAAIEAEAASSPHDFRTRVLLRDSFIALSKRWGGDQARARLSQHATQLLDALLSEDLGQRGFPSLEVRLMEQTRAATIEQFFRELGSSIRDQCSMNVGGSCGLILQDLLQRRTDDIDAVDEVPAAIRNDHALMDSLIARYGLRLAHFQSHYLPDHWQSRLKSFGVYGKLHVFLVDSIDIALGKLFSRREKDLDDLRLIVGRIDRAILEDRLNSSGAGLMSDIQFRQNAQHNWYILFGEELPLTPPSSPA